MAYRDVILADSPVNYWRLGESSGNAIDEMGEHDLTWAGTPVYSATGALVNDSNTAMTLDGVTEYAKKAISAYRGSDNQGSIEFWAKTTAVSGDAGFIGSGDTSVLTGIQVYLRTSDGSYSPAIYIVSASGNVGIDSKTAINDGDWHHVVVLSNGSAIKIYVDAVDTALDVTTGTNTGKWWNDTTEGRDWLSIGGLYHNDSTFSSMAGSIDEVAVYNYPLTAAQILRHYQSGLDTLHRVSGTITDDTGTPCARTIGLLRRDNFDLLGTATSDASTGAYAINDLDYDGECIRIVLDDSAGTLYNDLIDRVIPG